MLITYIQIIEEIQRAFLVPHHSLVTYGSNCVRHFTIVRKYWREWSSKGLFGSILEASVLHGRGCRETEVHLMTAMMQRERTCLWLSSKGTQSIKGCCTHLRCGSSLDYLFGNGLIDTSINVLEKYPRCFPFWSSLASGLTPLLAWSLPHIPCFWHLQHLRFSIAA